MRAEVAAGIDLLFEGASERQNFSGKFFRRVIHTGIHKL
jgi:hypothetical protein